jgi:uncharacterized damage-inducible protein DinB
MFRSRTFALASALALSTAGMLHAGSHSEAAPAAQPAAMADPAATAGAGTLSDADRAMLMHTLELGLVETDALVAAAQGELFTKKPAEDRWSVAEIVEHIGATEEALLGAVQGALASPADPDAAQLMAASPIATFNAVIRDRSQRFQAPDNLRPTGGKSQGDVMAQYHAARQKTLELVRTTQAAVANHTLPMPMGKMTAHHLLTLIAAHNLRHNEQIAEALRQLTTPPAEAAAAPAPATN